MIEYYLLTTVQLDAIARSIRIALESEQAFVAFVSATNRDLAMLDVTQQRFSELYKYKNHGPYILELHFAEYQKPALQLAASYALGKTLHLRPEDNRVHEIIAQNFPDFDSKQASMIPGVWVIPEGQKTVPDPV